MGRPIPSAGLTDALPSLFDAWRSPLEAKRLGKVSSRGTPGPQKVRSNHPSSRRRPDPPLPAGHTNHQENFDLKKKSSPGF